jgi:phage baseplate assembly protein W
VNVDFPYHLDSRGRTATASYDAHVLEMIELLLFTRPGERVNQPQFGCGLTDLVFGPDSPEVAAALNVTLTAAIGQWLGDVIALTRLDVTSVDSQLIVNLAYTVLATGTAADVALSVPGAR